MRMISPLTKSQTTPRIHEPSVIDSKFDDLAADSELLAIFVETRSRIAAEKLIRRHGPLVAGVVRRMLQNANDAEDAFQATFLILIKSAAKIRKQGSLASWLYGVAYRTACRIRRQSKERRMVTIEEPTEIPSHDEIDPIEKIATESQLELLDRELNSLPSSTRDILIEHHLLGLSVPQIADRFDLTNSAVEGRLRRGRAALRQKLARRGISFSVAIAVASAYQSRCEAMFLDSWQHSFFQTEIFSQTVTNGTTPTDGPFHSLIQGEKVMSSIFTTKWVSLAAASIVLAGGLGVMQFGSSGQNELNGSSVFISSASAETDALVAPVVIAQNASTAQGSEASTATPIASVDSIKRSNPLTLNGSGPLSLSQGSSLLAGDKGAKNGPQQAHQIVAYVKPEGPLPNWMTSGGTIAEENEKAREILRRDMRKLVKPNFSNVPLHVALEMLSKETQIPVRIDTVAMEIGSATPEDPVTLTGLREMSLQKVLKLILEPMDLTYAVEPDYLLITTKDAGSGRELRTYDLAYLLPSNEKAAELVNLIQSMVKSNWESGGGEDTLQVFGSMLLASCPEETHQGIEGILFSLSKMTSDNIAVPSYRAAIAPPSGGMGGEASTQPTNVR